MKEKVAVIDIGSNTIRLVIYEKLKDGRQFKEIDNIKKTARLRAYLNDQQFLKEKGITLLLETLISFKTMINLYRVNEVFCVATAAIRQAKNKEDIVKMIQEKTGFSIDVLDEYQEAYYGYLAVAQSIDIPEGITIDVGGGSTEVTYFCNDQLVNYVSLPFGALSLKLQFVKGDIPTDQELIQIRGYIQSQFESLSWVVKKHIPIIAIGGSARNIAQLHQSIIQYPIAGIHQYEMSISDITEVRGRIKPLSFAGLQNAEGLSRDRADTILPSLEVFEILCDLSEATKFILSGQGLREGVLYSKCSKIDKEVISLVDSDIHELLLEYNIDQNKANQLSKIAAMLFEQIKEIKGIGIDLLASDLNLLKRGACIYLIGKYSNEESSAVTFCLLTNRQIVGLSHRDRVKLALVASYKGRRAFRQYIDPFKNWYSKEDRKKLCLLGVILKLSQCLNTTERNNILAMSITPYEKCWIMNIKCQNNFAPEQYQLEKQIKPIEKLLKITIVPEFQLIH